MNPDDARGSPPRRAREIWAQCLAYCIYLVIGALAAAALIVVSDTWTTPYPR